MATDNRPVMVYLPEKLEKLVGEYCLSKGITRKDKKDGSVNPSLGSGILEILEEYFTSDISSNTVSGEVNTGDIEATVKGILPGLVPSNVVTRDELTESIDSVKAQLPKLIEDALYRSDNLLVGK